MSPFIVFWVTAKAIFTDPRRIVRGQIKERNIVVKSKALTRGFFKLNPHFGLEYSNVIDIYCFLHA